MSRDAPTLDEQYGAGAERADAEAQSETEFAEAIAHQVVLNVCELPDYNSPDDQPELVMCTVDELHNCVMRAFEARWEADAMRRAHPTTEKP